MELICDSRLNSYYNSSIRKNVSHGILTELECMSTLASDSKTPANQRSSLGVGSRHVLSSLKYIQPLVEKYGGNVKSMAFDLKLNPEQRTVGQLRRLLRKAGLPIQD